MGNHFVIGDVHGCMDEMMLLLEKIHQRDSTAQIIFVGDLVDRGPKVQEVLQWAMDHITENGKYQCVMGNHDKDHLKWRSIFSDENGDKVVDFLSGLPYSKKVEVTTAYGQPMIYRIVHAWYDYKEPENSEQQRQCNLWTRNYWGNYSSEEVIVHGHTPTVSQQYLLRGRKDSPGMIGYRHNAINVDGGCCYQSRSTSVPCMLCAICLETLEEIYPYTLEERFLQILEHRFLQEQMEKGALLSMDQKVRELHEEYSRNLAAEYRENYRKEIPSERQELLDRIKGIQ